MTNKKPIAKTSELKEGTSKRIELEGLPILLVNFKGKIRAFENICPHEGGPSNLEGDKLVCEWHGNKFNPETGRTIDGPAAPGTELKELPLKIEEGKIYLRQISPLF